MPNTTPAAGEAMPKIQKMNVCSASEGALIDLEADICDLYLMAHITDHLLDQFIAGRHQHNEIMLNSYELNMLIFSWKNVSSRAHALKERFYTAAELRGAQ